MTDLPMPFPTQKSIWHRFFRAKTAPKPDLPEAGTPKRIAARDLRHLSPHLLRDIGWFDA